VAKKRVVFSVATPLGYRVVLSRDRWREIIRFKHPVLAGRESDVRESVHDPDVIRASTKDARVHLYYRAVDVGYVCVGVGEGAGGEHFVITAYLARSVKKGQELWTR
jgi:hypothetical protein